MSRIKLGLTFCLFIAAAFAIAYGYKQEASSSMQLCKHQYALCTSAPCIPQPDDLTKAICFCDVEEGASMSSAPCNTIQPSTDANGIRTVYSAFSLEQFKQGKKVLTCPSGTPWTWCLNKRCTVDPLNPQESDLYLRRIANPRMDHAGRQLRHRHLHDRILVRRNAKGLQRSECFYGQGTWPRPVSR
jgi:hypothetical protein